MTQEPTRTQQDEPSADPPGPARRAAGWFGGLSRGRKLTVTWSV